MSMNYIDVPKYQKKPEIIGLLVGALCSLIINIVWLCFYPQHWWDTQYIDSGS